MGSSASKARPSPVKRKEKKIGFLHSDLSDSDEERMMNFAQSKVSEGPRRVSLLQSKLNDEPAPYPIRQSKMDDGTDDDEDELDIQRFQSKRAGDDDDEDDGDEDELDDEVDFAPQSKKVLRVDRLVKLQSKRPGDSDSDDSFNRSLRQMPRGASTRQSKMEIRRMRKKADHILKSNIALYEKTRKLTCDLISMEMGKHVKALKNSYTSFNNLPYDMKSYYRSQLYQPMLASGSMFGVCTLLFKGLQEDVYFTHDSDPPVKTVVAENAELLSNCLQTICSFTDTSAEIRDMVSQHPVLLPLLVKKLDAWYQSHMAGTVLDIEDKYVNKTLALFYLMSAEEETAHIRRLRNIPGFFSIMKKFMSSKSEDNRLTAIAALAGVANEAEAKDIAAEPGMIRFLLQQLRLALSDGTSSAGWTVVGLSKVVKNLARNDANKQLLVQEGAALLLSTGLEPEYQKSKNYLERKHCLESLWWLSFDEKNREELIKNTDLLDSVVSIYSEGPSQDPCSCYSAAEGFLYQMREHLKKIDKYLDIANQLLEDTSDYVPAATGHVMMSYQSQQRPVVKMVCDFLKENGFAVWMDIYNMADGEQSTLQTMAEAVEGAAVVAMCVSENYKDSPYCRAEAEYAFMKNKLIIPLKLQKGYTPDGWLGIIQGSKYFYDFTNENRYEEKRTQLLEAVRKAYPNPGLSLTQSGDFTGVKQSLQFAVPIPVPTMTMTSKPAASSFKDRVKTWTKTDVQAWLKKYNLKGSKLEELGGEEIMFLYDMKSEAPESFHTTIRTDLELSGISTMASFNKALTELPSDTSKH